MSAREAVLGLYAGPVVHAQPPPGPGLPTSASTPVLTSLFASATPARTPALA